MIYQYTSVDSIIKILRTKTLKFNNLTECDDIEEAESADLKRVGRFVYVSCWTLEEAESIPMWSQYADSMRGVRLGMMMDPFLYREQTNRFGKGTISSALDLGYFETDNKMSFVADQPKEIEIEYTDDESKIYPQVISEDKPGAMQRIITGTVRDGDKATISVEPIGRYKRTLWAYQKEIRYKVFGTPMGVVELSSKDDLSQAFERQRIVLRRMLDPAYNPPYSCIFVQLSDEAVNGAELMLGPKMTGSDRQRLMDVLQETRFGGTIRLSGLKIR